jgi:histidine triad (HIT) family protein
MNDCIFCRIVKGEIPSKKVYEDEHTYAFEDLDPKAPTHVLVVPKKHIRGLKEAEETDAEVVGRCHLAAAKIAKQRGIEDGYRTVLNVGPGSGQSVFHMHVHLLGGRKLAWPPG